MIMQIIIYVHSHFFALVCNLFFFPSMKFPEQRYISSESLNVELRSLWIHRALNQRKNLSGAEAIMMAEKWGAQNQGGLSR